MTATVEPSMKKKSTHDEPVKTDLAKFVKDNIDNPLGAKIVVNQIAEHWFRVHYFKVASTPSDCLVEEYERVDCRMVEVVSEGKTLKIEDRTIRSCAKPSIFS